MSPGVSPQIWRQRSTQLPGSVVWPSLIAILFAALSVISFAIDASMTLSPPPELPAADGAR